MSRRLTTAEVDSVAIEANIQLFNRDARGWVLRVEHPFFSTGLEAPLKEFLTSAQQTAASTAITRLLARLKQWASESTTDQ